MTLTIHTEEDDQRQLMLTVEVPEKRVQETMRQLARKFGRDITVPGFRRGKAPYRVLVKRIGEGALRADAVEDLVQPMFEDAVEQEEIEVYGRPEFTDMEGEPLQFKYTVPLPPIVELGEYRELRGDVEQVDISEDAVDEAMESLREQHRTVEDVDRPVEAGDLVAISGQGTLFVMPEAEEETEGETETEEAEGDDAVEEEETTMDELLIFDEERIELPMDDTKLFAGTPFVENLVGMAVGDSKTFHFTFPEDYEEAEFAGNEAEFEIEILNVQSRTLPELTDEFAAEHGDFESLDEWRADVRTNLEKQAEQELKNALIESTIDDLLTDAAMVYPPAAVEMEIDGMVSNFEQQVQRAGWEMADFLKMQGKTDEALRDDFRENANEQLKRQLALRQFVLDEKLRVEEADVDAAIEEKLTQFGDNEDFKSTMKGYYKEGYGLESISSEVLMDKVYARMVAILQGNAPDLAELEAETADAAADEEE